MITNKKEYVEYYKADNEEYLKKSFAEKIIGCISNIIQIMKYINLKKIFEKLNMHLIQSIKIKLNG